MTGNEKKAKDVEAGTPSFGLSYGLVFGQHERKAIAMSILDSTLRAGHGGEGNPAPANDQEMVLSNTDGIESFGFVEHLKLPHFVTFGATIDVSERRPVPAASNGHRNGATDNGSSS
jgi:alpha-D-ribose 1-methylphosphonate 5-triphosphate synthase subunit PhnI